MRCLGRLFALIALLVLGGVVAWRAGWLAGPLPRGSSTPAAEEIREPPSEALAEAAEAKLLRLRNAQADRVALGAPELESLLVYRHSGLLPGFLDEPRIDMRGEQLLLRGQVPAEHLPRIPELVTTLSLLPDTVSVELTGTVAALDERRAAVSVQSLELAGVPVPRRLIRPLLDRIGRTAETGLPGDAIAVPLPPGVLSLYVRADSLVLIRHGGHVVTDDN